MFAHTHGHILRGATCQAVSNGPSSVGGSEAWLVPVTGSECAPPPRALSAIRGRPPHCQTAGARAWRAGAASARATGTVYLPRLRSELAQFSFLSGRASRRQRVRLQGQPGTGEMTGEKRDRDFKRRSRCRGEVLSAVSSEQWARSKEAPWAPVPSARPNVAFRTAPCVCPAFVAPVPASSLGSSPADWRGRPRAPWPG